MTKKEIQNQLKSRNISFNSKATKPELEALLKPILIKEVADGLKEVKDNIITESDTNFKDMGISAKELEEGLLEAKAQLLNEKEDDFKVDKYEASYKSKGRIHILGSYATVKDAENALNKAGAHIRYIKHIDK
jgi:hypothetical protein